MKMNNEEFFCPLYGKNITEYDCDELTCGVMFGWIPNDGLPPLMSMSEITQNKSKCLDCERCEFAIATDGSILHLYYTPPKIDEAERRAKNEKTKKTFGKSAPHGFDTVFSLRLPRVYLTEALWNIWKKNDGSSEMLDEILTRIAKEDYGEVTTDESDFNGEQRWLACSFNGVVGRYHTDLGMIRFDCNDQYATLSLE